MEDIEIIKKSSIKKKKNLIGIIFSCIMIITVIGISYAYFGYYKEGLYTHTFNGGKMDVIYDEITGNNISISDAYPFTDNEALNEAMEFEFTVTGYNESEKNIYYAIELGYGNEVQGKTRFRDSDFKLSLYENDDLVIENEIFNNLNDQGIYFGRIVSGTDSENKVINNYKLRLWISDNVVISNTIEDDTTLWDDDDFNWAYNHLTDDQIYEFTEGNVTKLSDVGINVYKTVDFGNLYGSFKVNVMANLTGEDIGALMYDANGGEYTPKMSMLTTNKVTSQKPIMENKGFLGWSTDKLATTPEYYAGDYYSGLGTTLYAVYSDEKNIMGTFPEEILNYSYDITSVKFIGGIQNNIDSKYNDATIKWDLTYNNQGDVKGWIDEDTLYIGSSGTTYLTNCENMFSGFENLINIDFANADTSMVTNMSGMFAGCYSLTSIAIDVLNTKEVTNMSGMFYNCWGIYELDLSNFDTNLVTDMSYMFYDCCELTQLNISSFETKMVTNMARMFGGSSLDEGWTAGGNGLKRLDLSNFDTSNVTNMSGMFNGCSYYLEELIFSSSFNTSNVTDMSWMFADFSDISIVDFSNFDTSKVENMSYMFLFNTFPEDFNFDFLEVDSVTDMSYMFGHTRGYFNFMNKDLSNVQDMNGMVGNSNLESLKIENCILNPNLRTGDVFSGYSPTAKFKSISFSGTKNITSISFNHQYSGVGNDRLEKIDFSYCTFVDRTSLSQFIAWTDVLEVVDFTGCDFGEITSFYNMFYCCDNIRKIIFDDSITNNLTDLSYMFDMCRDFERLEVLGLDTSNVTNMSNMFNQCGAIKELILDFFDTSNVTNMSYLFAMSSLEYLDISTFTFSNSVDLTAIFKNANDNLIILVKSETEQERILNLSSANRPSSWTIDNVVIKY